MTSRMQTKLFNAIMTQCKSQRRHVHFSAYVRFRLEQYEREVRKEIVSRKELGCAPLYHACELGNVEMVEYLISVCGADVDQTGQPYRRHLETPLQSACIKAKNCHFGVVRCLVQHGADIQRADTLFDRTCLMHSVVNVKLCKFLLKNGADVDARDPEKKTALHYAIEKRMLDTVKLLLDYGADVTLRSLDNDDALQTACIARFRPIFDYLVEHGSYSPGRLADANELMGSRCFRDRQTALEYWHKAMEIRNSNTVDGNPLAKTPSMPKRDCYRNASEFTTLDELNAIALDSVALGIQSLLIHERILGEYHTATFDALSWIPPPQLVMTGLDFDTDEPFRYHFCFDLWKRALEISAVNDSIFWCEVSDVAQAVVLAMIHSHERILEVADRNSDDEEQPRFADVVAIFKLLTNRLVTAQPPSEKEEFLSHTPGIDHYEVIVKCVAYLIDLLVKTARSSEAEDEVRALVRHLVNQNPMSPRYDDTLLHLCVSGDNTVIVSRYFPFEYERKESYPRLKVVKLLLECGADVNARSVSGQTPLHRASSSRNFSNRLVKLLLDHGAHLDTPDGWGSTPAQEISAIPDNTVDLGNYMTLRCFAAQAIVKYKIQYNNLPASVNQFLDLHRKKY